MNDMKNTMVLGVCALFVVIVPSLLIQFDNLNTGELEQAVLLKQNFVKEKKKTRANQKNQVISALIFAVVFLGLMVELFNCVYVAFFSNADLFNIVI